MFDELTDGTKKITGQWHDISDLKIPDLKVLPTKVFARIWSIAVADFLLTLVDCLWLESYHFDILDLKNLKLFYSFHDLKD